MNPLRFLLSGKAQPGQSQVSAGSTVGQDTPADAAGHRTRRGDTAGTGDSSAGAAPLPAIDQARRALQDLLSLEGCQPRIDSDGDIVFRHQQLTYVVVFSRKDPEFVRLVLPNFWTIDSEAELKAAYRAANLANSTCKAAKVYVEHRQTLAAVECFMAAPEQLVPVVLRSADALADAAKTFGVACALDQGR